MAKKTVKLPTKLPTITSALPMPYPSTSEDKERERKYRAQDALSDIERAEKHKADKGLMSDVKKLAKEKMNHLKKIC